MKPETLQATARTLRKYITEANHIFVFGSNLAGRHGAGAALEAKKYYGAKQGKGQGLENNSYALPTKDLNVETLSLDDIEKYVKVFKEDASLLPDKTFFVTAIGTGLAGYSVEQIAPMFVGSPKNCVFDVRFKPFLGTKYMYFQLLLDLPR